MCGCWARSSVSNGRGTGQSLLQGFASWAWVTACHPVTDTGPVTDSARGTCWLLQRGVLCTEPFTGNQRRQPGVQQARLFDRPSQTLPVQQLRARHTQPGHTLRQGCLAARSIAACPCAPAHSCSLLGRLGRWGRCGSCMLEGTQAAGAFGVQAPAPTCSACSNKWLQGARHTRRHITGCQVATPPR